MKTAQGDCHCIKWFNKVKNYHCWSSAFLSSCWGFCFCFDEIKPTKADALPTETSKAICLKVRESHLQNDFPCFFAFLNCGQDVQFSMQNSLESGTWNIQLQIDKNLSWFQVNEIQMSALYLNVFLVFAFSPNLHLSSGYGQFVWDKKKTEQLKSRKKTMPDYSKSKR